MPTNYTRERIRQEHQRKAARWNSQYSTKFIISEVLIALFVFVLFTSPVWIQFFIRN